jgi:polyisoprenoid-binding protein YceI
MPNLMAQIYVIWADCQYKGGLTECEDMVGKRRFSVESILLFINLTEARRRMRQSPRWLRLTQLTLPLLLVLLLAACSNGIEGETAVQTETTNAAPTVTAVTPAAEADEPEDTVTNEAETAETETAEATETGDLDEAEEVEAADDPGVSDPDGQATRFQIDTELSEARFHIGEVLRGEPFTVIGVTNQVNGELIVNLDNPSQTEIGEITVDASTLVTDNNMRNRAIYNFVLNTSLFQFVRFNPTALHGLPEEISVGQTVEFQIEGELTIRDVTQTVLFDTVVNLVSEEEIRGQASTVIERGDFNLTIPSVPQVAGVDEELRLEIEFVATAVP